MEIQDLEKLMLKKHEKDKNLLKTLGQGKELLNKPSKEQADRLLKQIWVSKRYFML